MNKSVPLYKVRARVYMNMWMTKHRRQKSKEIHGPDSERYREISRRATRTLENCKAKIRRIDELAGRNELMKVVDRALGEFIGVSIRDMSSTCRVRSVLLARNLFYKYCMEHGIKGRDAAQYCRCAKLDSASKQRMRFTRSFSTNPENRDMWHRFQEFMKSCKTP
jgi:hypothetical protein